MRAMVFMKATEASESGAPPTLEAFEAMERFTEELVAAGVLVAGAGLKNSAGWASREPAYHPREAAGGKRASDQPGQR